MVEVSRAQFEELVAEALDRVPPELTTLMRNVVVLVEDQPPGDQPTLLGLYEGVALTDRGIDYAGVLPDRITIYQSTVQRVSQTAEQLVAEVTVTVVHEIAHHFGIGEARLHELGWG